MAFGHRIRVHIVITSPNIELKINGLTNVGLLFTRLFINKLILAIE